MEWVNWHNHTRPYSWRDGIPPVKHGRQYYRQKTGTDTTAPAQPSLH